MAPTDRPQTSELHVATLRVLAALLGVKEKTLKDWRARGMPGREKAGWPIGATIRWLRESGPWKPRQRPRPDDADPLLQGPDSPAMERYRRARARWVELDLEEREYRVVDAAKLREGLRRAAGLIRSAGERLARDYGNAARDILDTAIDNAQRELDHLLDAGSNGAQSGDPS